MDILFKHAYKDEWDSEVDYVLDILAYCTKPTNNKPRKEKVATVDMRQLSVFVLPPIFYNHEDGSYTLKSKVKLSQLETLDIRGDDGYDVDWGLLKNEHFGHFVFFMIVSFF